MQFIVPYVHSLYNKAKEMIFMAAATTNISIRMDYDLKARADAFFGDIGMILSTEFNDNFSMMSSNSWQMASSSKKNIETIHSPGDGKDLENVTSCRIGCSSIA